MHSAIGPRKDFNNLDEDQLLAEYKVCLEGLLEHEQVLKLDLHTQHCNTSRLQHSINVSYYSFLICYKIGVGTIIPQPEQGYCMICTFMIGG